MENHLMTSLKVKNRKSETNRKVESGHHDDALRSIASLRGVALRRVCRGVSTLVVGGLFGGILGGGLMTGCAKAPADPVFDPRGLGDPQRMASTGLAESATVNLPEEIDRTYFDEDTTGLREKSKQEPLLEKLDELPTVVRLDLRAVLQRAVVANVDVRVAGFTPGIDETRVIEAEARFDPTAFSSLTFDRQKPVLQSNALQSSNFQSLSAQVGIRQLLESGGEVRLQYQSQLIDNKGATFGQADDPRFANDLQLQLTQPLLRDFGNEINRARIVINRNNQHVSLLEFRNTLEETLFNIERTYWQLVQAQRDVEQQQTLLDQTLQTIIILSARQRQDVTREQISRANQSLEARRAQLVRAKARVADLSDQLKRFMNDPALPIAGPELVLPGTEPAETQIVFDPREQIDAGLLHRAELGQQIKRVDNAAVAMGVARNNLLPRLDLVLQGSLQGIDDDFIDAAADQVERNYNGTFQAGLQFEVPLGNRAARAILRRAQLQHLQAIAQYDVQIQQVTLEVKQSLRNVDTTYQEIARARAARFAAADALDAIQTREDQGEPLTPEFVDRKLRSQEALAQAGIAENEAVANYNIALATLERAKGTLLRYNNVIIAEDTIASGR
jgi:outer membrane protein TolC